MFPAGPAGLPDLFAEPDARSGEWCDLDAGVIVTLSSETGPDSFYLPRHYEPAYQYPLVLWMESRPGEMEDWLPRISDRNYVAAVVRGPLAARQALGGSAWPSDDRAPLAATQALERTRAIAAAEFSIHPERIFIAGTEFAGALALTVGLTHPAEFAGTAAIDPGPAPLMLLLREFRRMKSRRVFLGTRGEAASRRRIEELADLLATAGTDLTFQAAPGPHRQDDLARRLDSWLMRTICPGTFHQP